MERAAQKASHDKPFTFRRKAHHKQLDFHRRVAEYLEKAADEITKRPTNITSLAKAKVTLDCCRTNSQITGTVVLTVRSTVVTIE